MDEHNLRIFLLCTHSVAGALPLSVIITSDEQLETLIMAFSLLKDMLGDNPFYGKAAPQVFMTDNCSELRGALHRVFPESILLLCTFHILQQVWHWLFEKNHGIAANDRVDIMKGFRKLVHVQEVHDFNTMCDEFFELPSLSKYPAAVLYFCELGNVISNII